jgi:hypothetical protein
MAILIIHGILHLAGYDHTNTAEEKEKQDDQGRRRCKLIRRADEARRIPAPTDESLFLGTPKLSPLSWGDDDRWKPEKCFPQTVESFSP